jgi:hypothetical protein
MKPDWSYIARLTVVGTVALTMVALFIGSVYGALKFWWGLIF